MCVSFEIHDGTLFLELLYKPGASSEIGTVYTKRQDYGEVHKQVFKEQNKVNERLA